MHVVLLNSCPQLSLPTIPFELRNIAVDAAIPGGFKLRLLTHRRFTALSQQLRRSDNCCRTTLCGSYPSRTREGMVWEIEPLPENYN